MKWLCHAYMMALLSPVPNRMLLRQLYGEWMVLHSNHPEFSSTNSKFLTILPKNQLVVKHHSHVGPILIFTETSGRFAVQCRTEDNLENGIIQDAFCDVNVQWGRRKHTIHSIFGLVVNEALDLTPVQESLDNTTSMQLSVNLFENGNLYLSDDESIDIHLTRNTQPSGSIVGGIPLSTFVATQILGSMLLSFLHHYFHFILND